MKSVVNVDLTKLSINGFLTGGAATDVNAGVAWARVSWAANRAHAGDLRLVSVSAPADPEVVIA